VAGSTRWRTEHEVGRSAAAQVQFHSCLFNPAGHHISYIMATRSDLLYSSQGPSKKTCPVRCYSHAQSEYPGPIVSSLISYSLALTSTTKASQPRLFQCFSVGSLSSMVPRCYYFNPLHTKFGAILPPHSVCSFSLRVPFTSP
jgi:hypothetical protein